ncbi:MAG: hypothetical protein H7062_10960 [Candidatus Saccharimonas sp.]|nr:hypothetical protein [Planctomycetaceae bacterium]
MSTTLVDKVIEPLTDCLTPEVAERIVNLRLDSQTQAKLDELAEKGSAGQLDASERADYQELVEALDFMGLLKSKARILLAARGS